MKQVLMRTGVAAAAAIAFSGLTWSAIPDETRDAPQVTASRAALVGEWKLNAQMSDDLRAKMREAMEEGRGRGGPGGWDGGGRPPSGGPGGVFRPGGGGGFGGGRGGPGGRGGFGAGRGRPRGDRDRVPPLALQADRLTITNLEPEITMLEPDGGIRRLHADGKSYKDSNDASVKARWDGSALLVETRGERGGRIREAWSVDRDPRRLTVTLEVALPFGGTVKGKRVFDPVPDTHGGPTESWGAAGDDAPADSTKTPPHRR